VRVIRWRPAAGLSISSETLLPEGGLLAIALDPSSRRRAPPRALRGDVAQTLAFTVARFRHLNQTFGERAVLLDRIPASQNRWILQWAWTASSTSRWTTRRTAGRREIWGPSTERS
jgi:hypothetical protein